MSVEAITWALSQPVERSSTKFVLVAMANCAGADGLCWPSAQYLADATAQDRKTVVENLKRLRDAGYITPTDERRGSTSQVVVYRLNTPKNGPVEPPQKRNSSENGTVPKTEAKRPVFPAKEARFSPETGPKTGHGTVIEPSIEPSGKRKDPGAAGGPPSSNGKVKPPPKPEVSLQALIDAGFDADTAGEFLEHKRRRKAPLTERAWKDHLREAAAAGWTPVAAAEKVMARNWSGFEAKYVASERNPKQAQPPPRRQPQSTADRNAKAKQLLGFGNQPPTQEDFIDV